MYSELFEVGGIGDEDERRFSAISADKRKARKGQSFFIFHTTTCHIIPYHRATLPSYLLAATHRIT